MSVGDEFARLVSDDELCAKVRRAVEGGDEDALRRLGFGGFGGYAQRLSELMSDSVREGHDPQAEDFAAIMEEVARPVHYAHHLVNEVGTAVQRAKDEPLGIHMKPQETDFDDEAFRSTVGNAASMGTPEKTVEALAEGLAYAVKKTGNDFIKANAEAHSRAGFEVKVKRSGSTKCCPWCAARIGSWAIANAPDGVFGCHANCSCTVEYTSSTGAKTSARGANLHRFGAGAFVEAEYQPPHVGAVQGAEKVPHRLTGAANGGIIGLGAKIGGDRFVPLHEEPKPIKTINPNDKASVLAEIAVFEKWAANSAIENACVITRNGEVYYCFGIEDRVFVDYDLGDKLTGAFVSHNHVKGISEYSFSNDDFDLFIAYSLKLLRGIDDKYEYELSNDYSDVPSEPEILTYEDSQHFMTIRSAESYGVGYRRWLR